MKIAHKKVFLPYPSKMETILKIHLLSMHTTASPPRQGTHRHTHLTLYYINRNVMNKSNQFWLKFPGSFHSGKIGVYRMVLLEENL